jgi:hypothetical protein
LPYLIFSGNKRGPRNLIKISVGNNQTKDN